MGEMGYILKKIVAYEYNTILIMLAKNEKNSCTSKTRHINIRCFGVKDQLNYGKLTMEYCPIDEMFSDFFTNPLQFTMFEILDELLWGGIK